MEWQVEKISHLLSKITFFGTLPLFVTKGYVIHLEAQDPSQVCSYVCGACPPCQQLANTRGEIPVQKHIIEKVESHQGEYP